MKKLIVMVFGVLFSVSSFASVISDFSWVPAVPSTSASSVLSDGTEVTLTSSTVPFEVLGASALVQDAASDSDTTITLSFDRTISSLSLSINDLDTGSEYFQAFSILPSLVTADLQLLSGVVSSTSGGGEGQIIWYGLNTNAVSFDYVRPLSLGVFLTGFEISSVPEPSSILVFLTGLYILMVCYRRGACAA